MRSEVNMDCWMLMLLQWVPHYTTVRVFLGRCSPRCGLLCAAEPDECWACSRASHALHTPCSASRLTVGLPFSSCGSCHASVKFLWCHLRGPTSWYSCRLPRVPDEYALDLVQDCMSVGYSDSVNNGTGPAQILRRLREGIQVRAGPGLAFADFVTNRSRLRNNNLRLRQNDFDARTVM